MAEKEDVKEKSTDSKQTNKDEKSDFSEKVKEYKSEIKRIVWPKPREVFDKTIIVLVISTIFGVVIFGINTVYTEAHDLIFDLTFDGNLSNYNADDMSEDVEIVQTNEGDVELIRNDDGSIELVPQGEGTDGDLYDLGIDVNPLEGGEFTIDTGALGEEVVVDAESLEEVVVDAESLGEAVIDAESLGEAVVDAESLEEAVVDAESLEEESFVNATEVTFSEDSELVAE